MSKRTGYTITIDEDALRYNATRKKGAACQPPLRVHTPDGVSMATEVALFGADNAIAARIVYDDKGVRVETDHAVMPGTQPLPKK